MFGRAVLVGILAAVAQASAPWTSTSWELVGNSISGQNPHEFSGWSVSISSDSNRLAVHAAGDTAAGGVVDGLVRVYERTYAGSNAWAQIGDAIEGVNVVDADVAGSAVTLSADGRRMAVGFPAEGRVRLYEWISTAWYQLGQDIDGDEQTDQFGSSVATSAYGTRVAIGSLLNGSGVCHVRIYEWRGSGWTQLGQHINGSAGWDASGCSVSLSADGGRMVMGAPESSGAGHVCVYHWDEQSTMWLQLGLDIDEEVPGSFFGWSVSHSAVGTMFAIGAPGLSNASGYVRVYNWTGDAQGWSQLGSDIGGTAPGDGFGHSVSMSEYGNILAVGAPHVASSGHVGYVHLYELSASGWTQLGEQIAGAAVDDHFGRSVSISAGATFLAVGAPGNDVAGASAGSTYVHRSAVAEELIVDYTTDAPTLAPAPRAEPSSEPAMVLEPGILEVAGISAGVAFTVTVLVAVLMACLGMDKVETSTRCMFYGLELVDVIQEVANFALVWWSGDLEFANDLGIVAALLAISIGFSITLFIVEVIDGIVGRGCCCGCCCGTSFDSCKPFLICLHIGFEDTFQLMIYSFVAAAQAQEGADTHSSVILAMVLASTSIFLKLISIFSPAFNRRERK